MLNLRYPPQVMYFQSCCPIIINLLLQISGLSSSPDSLLTPTLLVDPRDLEWDHSEHREVNPVLDSLYYV